jgi:hypothetical protein
MGCHVSAVVSTRVVLGDGVGPPSSWLMARLIVPAEGRAAPAVTSGAGPASRLSPQRML